MLTDHGYVTASLRQTDIVDLAIPVVSWFLPLCQVLIRSFLCHLECASGNELSIDYIMLFVL